MWGDAFLSAMWTAVATETQTVAGWAFGAASPIFVIFLALGTGYAIFRVCFEDDWHMHDDDEEDIDESGASDEARDYWKNHKDGVDL